MPRSRRRWLAITVFWLIQAAATLAGWPLLFFGEIPRDPDELGAIALVLATIMFLQAVFILPDPSGSTASAAPQSARTSARIARCLLGALALGLLVGWAGTGALALLSSATLSPPAPFPGWLRPWPLFAGPLIVSPIAYIPLWRASRHAMPAAISLIIAGATAAMLAAALIAALFSLLDLTLRPLSRITTVHAILLATLLLSWALSTPLLAAYSRRWPAATRLHNLALLLFGGTILSTAAIIPIDVMVRRKTDCYCGEGTFLSLTFCWAAGLIVLGPAIFLLPVRRRQRRIMRGLCAFCAYDLRSTPQLLRCPECGGHRTPQPIADNRHAAGRSDHDDRDDSINPAARPRTSSI